MSYSHSTTNWSKVVEHVCYDVGLVNMQTIDTDLFSICRKDLTLFFSRSRVLCHARTLRDTDTVIRAADVYVLFLFFLDHKCVSLLHTSLQKKV